MTSAAMEVVKELSPQGIKFNVTVLLSLPQALIACKAGGSFISFFAGRVDDMSSGDAVGMVNTYDFPRRPGILVASLRSPLQVVESVRAGAHIATIPFRTMDLLFHHPLTEIGIARFNGDYLKATGGDSPKPQASQSIEEKAPISPRGKRRSRGLGDGGGRVGVTGHTMMRGTVA